jgi:hypothetical protein
MRETITLRLDHPTLEPGRVQGYALIWAFYVRGFNPAKHCQFCFRGLRAPTFHSRNAASGVDIVLDRLDVSQVVYICGVAKGPDDQRRHRNLHLPVRYQPGAVASATTYNGYTVQVQNAMALDIPPVEDGWHGLPAKHTRCKNFQFGLAQFGASAVEVTRIPKRYCERTCFSGLVTSTEP